MEVPDRINWSIQKAEMSRLCLSTMAIFVHSVASALTCEARCAVGQVLAGISLVLQRSTCQTACLSSEHYKQEQQLQGPCQYSNKRTCTVHLCTKVDVIPTNMHSYISTICKVPYKTHKHTHTRLYIYIDSTNR